MEFLRTRGAALLALLFASAFATPAQAALVTYYSMNAGAGTALADQYNSYNGALTNMAPASDWVAGHTGGVGDYALDFDGSNDFVTMGTIPSWNPKTATPFSVQAWVYDRGGATAGIFGAVDPNSPNTGWGLNRVSNKFRIELSPASGAGFKVDVTAAHTLNQWYHVVATYDGSNTASGFKIYLNGALAPTTIAQNIASGATPTPQVLTLGSYGGANRFFNGQVDDVALWNHTLSATDVQQLYNGGTLFTNSNLRSLDISSMFNRDTIATSVAEPSGGGYRNNGQTFITSNFVGAATQLPNVPTNGEFRLLGSDFELGPYNGNNTWMLGVNQSSTLNVDLPPLQQLVVLFSAIGYNPTNSVNGLLTVTFADNTTQVFTWDIVDSFNNSSSDNLAQIALSGMDIFNANTDVFDATNNRSWFYQVFNITAQKAVKSLTFSTLGVGDSGNDANFGIYAINYSAIVPEPSSWVLFSVLAAGATVVGARQKRRRG